MRHGSAAPARVLLVTAVAGALAIGTTAAHAGSAASRATVKVLGTADNKFTPADVTVAPDAAGKATIEFTAQAGGAPHTITSDDAAFDSGIVDAGATKKVTFSAKPGSYSIYCTLHKGQGMVGTLTVTAAGAKNPDASSPAPQPSAPPASASASASVGSGNAGGGAPTPEASEGAAEEDAPGIAGNPELKVLDEQRAAQHGAVSGFRFFTMVALAFLVLLGIAVLFSTRPRRGSAA